MGWKVSMIIIENPNDFDDDISILKAIGKSNFKFKEETTLERCIYPGDKSISIGRYNGNIIISDDYQITTKVLEEADKLTMEEENLCKIFPDSEIVTIACHSVVNLHGYSLTKNGKKLRSKVISSDTPRIEFGQKLKEEEKLYSTSYQKEGVNFWKDEADPEEEYSEDQLMEAFTFGIANRRLGVYLDQVEGEELMEKIPFHKYTKDENGFFQRIMKSFMK